MKIQPSTFTRRMALALVNLWESPCGAALIAGLVYLLVCAYPSGRLFARSYQPFYNYLADAFLHGQTWLRILPPYMDDLVIFNGQFYLYWAPFPALVLMPLVAVFGVGLNDVLFTALMAAFNVGLAAQLLRAACRAAVLHLSKAQRAILTFFLAFGTVHFMLAQYGRVWYTGQIIGFTCVLFAYLSAFYLRGGRAWFFTGLALAAAMLTRSHMVFTGIFPAAYLLQRDKPWNWKRVMRSLAWGALPLAAAAIFYLSYNQARFGSPLDVGLAYIPYAGVYLTAFQRYGFFNLHYVPINFYYHYIFYPFPLRLESLEGGSLFLLSPLFFAAFAAFWKPREKIYVWALLASILVTDIPILLCMGTGFAQFGPRYTLDFTVPLLLLTALGMENWKPRIAFALAAISVVHYFIGVRVLG